ncbi:MAG: hypothetical protein HC822_20850 [Oscillochloris sp.]|nr:hypothetical protein [Oscillochloris sp.]
MLLSRRRGPIAALLLNLLQFSLSQAIIEHVYLRRPMPARRWWLLPILAWITPLHNLGAAFGSDTIEWRGQRIRIARGGRFTVIDG